MLEATFNATIGKDCEEKDCRCVGNNNDVELTSENGLKQLEFCTEQELYHVQ